MDLSLLFRILLYVLIGWLLYRRFVRFNGLKNLSENEFDDQLRNNRNAFLVDAREPDEFKTGHIRGAINIPLSQFEDRVNEIPKERDVLLYCRSGARSQRAAKILFKKGFKNIAHLQGGIMNWRGQLRKRS
ncbi:sulfurtransferase [Ammoniphilus oxalaticus]|uniref:Sulfurtransferase n=1 Tax=Ammoniphilus oxalaticus TaxID=66863 RepID=A0A419SMV8_9BACL|nr:rhodanese-like domain-containing protein [Ammoniphilus oxalaticus]RKD25541.1 sulfurtransferase [Ammoniphilus oxalaticus]